MKHHYLRNVTTLQLDQEKCTGCGICVIVCPHEVFQIKDMKAHVTDRDSCMECGACALNCIFDALKVHTGVGCAAALLKGKMVDGKLVCDSDCC